MVSFRYNPCSIPQAPCQSPMDQEATSSSITNFIVVKVMFSYNSLAAALAFACQGPRPPSRASSRLRQMPVQILARSQTRIKNPAYVIGSQEWILTSC